LDCFYFSKKEKKYGIFIEAFNKAISLMLSFDPELYGIIFLSLKISVIATIISTIIGQVLLATPIVFGLTIVVVQGIDPLLKKTAISLGASSFQFSCLIIREARYAIGAAVIAAFDKKYGVIIKVVSVGTGEAIEMGKQGNADVILVH